MMRQFYSCLLVSALSALPAAAQVAGSPSTGATGLRTSTFDGSGQAMDSTGGQVLPPAGGAAPSATGSLPAVNPTQAQVYSLIGGTEEAGSAGLVGTGRQSQTRPFSDRVNAVRRVSANGGQGGALGNDVFDGETTYDAPLGLRVGTFTVVPQLTVSGGWSDNAAGSSSGRANALYSVAPDLQIRSDWSRHQLDVSLRGSYAAYPGSNVRSEPSIDTRAALRLDAGDSTQINSSLGHSYSREDTSTAENPNGEGDVNVVNASLGVTREAGILAATLRGDVARTMYSEGQSGTDRSGRDNTLYSATLRLDARTGAMLQPFAEVTALRRAFDEDCAAPCIRRDAKGYALRSGVTIAAGPKLAGEVAAGWRVERLDSRQLQDLAGLTVDGSLVWSPTRLTTVTAGLTTTLSPSDLAGSSGSILYSADLRVSHALSERLVAQAGAGYARRHYQGVGIEEATTSALAGATYALTRNVALTGTYTYRTFDSSIARADYDENRIQAGVRIRR